MPGDPTKPSSSNSRRTSSSGSSPRSVTRRSPSTSRPTCTAPAAMTTRACSSSSSGWRPPATRGRELGVHFTGSAFVVDPATRTVLLRWHERQQGWLQVGGHVDPGEQDPFQDRQPGGAGGDRPHRSRGVARPATTRAAPGGRRARAGGQGRAAATTTPTSASSSPPAAHAHGRGRPDAPVRWMTFDEARAASGEDNVRIALDPVEALFDADARAVDGRGGPAAPSGRC